MRKKRIVMLSTGGTIASKINPKTGLLTAGILSGEELSNICNFPPDLNVEVISVFQIPSNHMTFEHLIILKEKIDEVFKNKDIDGIVVTHGTDTLEETAFFLDLVIADERPVVITGSQRGPEANGTDASVNLRQSILLAASQECRGFGTVVLFNERIFSGRYIKKRHASNVDGFTSFGFGYLGIVDLDSIYIYQKPVKKETYTLKSSLSNVEIVKCSLGSDGKFIDTAKEHGAKGIVIEAPGRGNVPPLIMESVKKAIVKGVCVILTTSTEEGKVEAVYDYPGSSWSLQNEGVIFGGDYDSKKARLKLAVMLASNIEEINETNFQY